MAAVPYLPVYKLRVDGHVGKPGKEMLNRCFELSLKNQND